MFDVTDAPSAGILNFVYPATADVADVGNHDPQTNAAVVVEPSAVARDRGPVFM